MFARRAFIMFINQLIFILFPDVHDDVYISLDVETSGKRKSYAAAELKNKKRKVISGEEARKEEGNNLLNAKYPNSTNTTPSTSVAVSSENRNIISFDNNDADVIPDVRIIYFIILFS